MAFVSAGACANPSAPGRRAAAIVAYLALAGAAAWGGLAGCGIDPGAVDTLLCALPVALGGALALGKAGDRRQHVARLVAAAVMLPLLLLMWVGMQEPEHALGLTVSVFVALYAVLHLVAALAGVALLAAQTTRVGAAPGVAAVGLQRLGQRLASLNQHGLELAVRNAGTDSVWQVEIASEAGRSRRVRLEIDDRARQVTVHERLGAAAAPGDAGAALPEATVIWSHEWQATMIDEAPLGSTVLAFDGDRALPPHAAAGWDGDALLRLLCALVTRSGYAWQPVLLGWPRWRRARR